MILHKFVQQPAAGPYSLLVGDALKVAPFDHLDAAIAYARTSGVIPLLPQVQRLPGRWLVGIDWCRTEPVALEQLAASPGLRPPSHGRTEKFDCGRCRYQRSLRGNLRRDCSVVKDASWFTTDTEWWATRAHLREHWDDNGELDMVTDSFTTFLNTTNQLRSRPPAEPEQEDAVGAVPELVSLVGVLAVTGPVEIEELKGKIQLADDKFSQLLEAAQQTGIVDLSDTGGHKLAALSDRFRQALDRVAEAQIAVTAEP